MSQLVYIVIHIFSFVFRKYFTMVSLLCSTLDVVYTTASGHDVSIYTYLGVGPRCLITESAIESLGFINEVIRPTSTRLYDPMVAGHLILPVLIGNTYVQLFFQVIECLPHDCFAFISTDFQTPNNIHLFPERQTFALANGTELSLVLYSDEELTIGSPSLYLQLLNHLRLISSLED